MASQSDKLFQKRKAKKREDLARRRPTLSERRRVLIVCEGGRTEPLYLQSLIASLGLTTAEVKICGECASAPKNIVKFGKEKIDLDPDFDLIFFVFDRDSHPDYNDALQMIRDLRHMRKFKGKTVEAITSVPCFEVWFLLHYEPNTKPYAAGGGKSACGNLISVLKKRDEFRSYEKGCGDYFDLLSGRLPLARRNAALTLKYSQDTGNPKHHGNPTTLMHTLVDYLDDVVADYRR